MSRAGENNSKGIPSVSMTCGMDEPCLHQIRNPGVVDALADSASEGSIQKGPTYICLPRWEPNQ